jgi:hypothetical protein
VSNTYSNNPMTVPLDRIRFILSDTGASGTWLFSDEELNWQLEEAGSVYAAAAEVAMIMSARYTDKRDKTVGPLSIKYGEIGDRWIKLAESLRKRGSRASGPIAIMTQKNTGSTHFRLGMHDNDYSELHEYHTQAQFLVSEGS